MLTKPIVVNHFAIYINQTIILYTLNLCSDGCQLFLSKMGEKRKKKEMNNLWRDGFPLFPTFNF